MEMPAVAAACLFVAGLVLPGCGESGGASSADVVARSATPPAGSGPRLTFDSLVHDFGVVSDTRTYSAGFRFTNTGDETLVISEVKPACGCTVPTLSRTTFVPGDGDVIAVEFDPAGQHGTADKYIAVASNAADGLIRLRVSALIRPLLDVEKFLRLGRLPLGRDYTSRVDLSYEDADLRITNLSGNNPHVTARIAEMGRKVSASKDQPAYRGALEVTVSKDAPWGVIYATRLAITVYGRPEPGADPVEHEYTVFVQGNLFGEVSAEPPILSIGNLDPRRSYEASATLTRDSGAPFSVLGAEIAETDLPGIGVRVEPQGASAARIIVHGSTGTFRGSFKGAVRVLTDVPGEESLTLRFGGFVR